MKVLCWDIDGTLLTTNRAGVFALEAAVAEVTGIGMDLSLLKTAGLTDRQIAADILTLAKLEVDGSLIDKMLALYGSYVLDSLPKRQGYVLPGVKAILDCLQQRDDVINLLLTGNIEAGANAKLSYYGLSGYFLGGAFADRAADRIAIAREAKEKALSFLGDVTPEEFYVIGDTPHDIKCGHAIDARVIAVATGGYTLEELSQYQPWWSVAQLPSPEVFLSKLGLYA